MQTLKTIALLDNQRFKLRIDMTARNNTQGEITKFDDFTGYYKALGDLKTALTERYGKLPRGKHKIYIDDQNGKAIEIGILYSFWNADYSHASLKKWFQTDWIVISIQTIEHFDYSQLLGGE